MNYSNSFKNIRNTTPIDIREVQIACIRDLFLEWAPKQNDLKWLENSHYQSYLILNLCRILYTVYCSQTGSKIISAAWVKEQYPQWQDLIETAEQWEYGQEMNFLKEAIDFIQFTITEISKFAAPVETNSVALTMDFICETASRLNQSD